jgi:Icc-related predicted phosphoesterase
MRGKRRRRSARGGRLFFATDVHGSDQCFRKWLNAARVFSVDALILGGDVTGKLLVPLVADDDGWHGEFAGAPVRVSANGDELAALQRRIRMSGCYDVLLSAEEKLELDHDPARLEVEFARAMHESLRRWIELAEERLEGTGVKCFMMLGNDDSPELAKIIRESELVCYAEDAVNELPGGQELLSLGYSTPTPWDTPRELSEEDLLERIERLVTDVARPERAVFNLHCPPRDTRLDQAPMLDAKMRPLAGAGTTAMTSVGSRAVREIIERTQPLLGLHGHVHESAAGAQLGSTLCLNPGSEYQHGVLRGAIVEFDASGGVAQWQLIQG